MTEYRQMNPYCVQVELTEGCNLRCSFCGLNGIRGKDNNYKFMTVKTAENIAASMAEHGWNSRIEMAMHGEPTMNPDMMEIVRIFRTALPKAYILMETNGGGIISNPKARITALFNNGLTTLAVDEYQDIKFAEKIFSKISDIADLNNYVTAALGLGDHTIFYYDYPKCGKEGNPHQRNKKKRLIRVRPIDVSTSGTHASLNNHAGAGAAPNDRAEGKRCAKPFRELSVRWDGGVAVCCNDWRGVVPIGNVNNECMHEDIWHSPVMYAARRKLYAGQRDFGACDGCDALSYRPGILPDHLGKVELDEPTAADEAMLATAISNGPMTEPVKRPWE